LRHGWNVMDNTGQGLAPNRGGRASR
jgi:hypothetical protein